MHGQYGLTGFQGWVELLRKAFLLEVGFELDPHGEAECDKGRTAQRTCWTGGLVIVSKGTGGGMYMTCLGSRGGGGG